MIYINQHEPLSFSHFIYWFSNTLGDGFTYYIASLKSISVTGPGLTSS